MDVSREQALIRAFAQDRDWSKFHTPKNLAMALAGEVGELLELFQWLTAEEAQAVMESEDAENVRDEMADVFIYLLRLADVLDIDLERALIEKMGKNADRYDVKTNYGVARKRH